MLSKFFGLKNKENSATNHLQITDDFSFLNTDIHSHFIPGIDDGAQTIEDSIALIRAMQEMGFKSLVTTPHIKFDHFPNNAETINRGLQLLRHALKEAGIDMPIRAAAEYYIDDQFMHLIEEEPLLTIRDNEILVEVSFLFEPMRLNEIFFKIETLGYQPILAHPERYTYYHQKPTIYNEFKDRGCMLQLNTIALTGYYGKHVKQVAESLLEQGLYDYCGSDMHHIRHADALKKLIGTKTFQQLQHYPFKNSTIKIA